MRWYAQSIYGIDQNVFGFNLIQNVKLVKNLLEAKLKTWNKRTKQKQLSEISAALKKIIKIRHILRFGWRKSYSLSQIKNIIGKEILKEKKTYSQKNCSFRVHGKPITWIDYHDWSHTITTQEIYPVAPSPTSTPIPISNSPSEQYLFSTS